MLAQVGADSLNMSLFGWMNPVGIDTAGPHSALWGYTDPNGREYALFASGVGTHIIDITEKPIRQVAYIWGPRSQWREMKTYGHYAYVITESRDSGTGLQIIDLSDLPDTARLLRTDTTVFTSGHTIYIRDHYLYVMGTQAAAGANGGAAIFDLEPDATHPRRVGQVTPYYFHDAWVRNDTLVGAAIYGNGCDIWKITDPANPVKLGNFNYPGSGTHNAEMSDDGRYVFTTDEIGVTRKTLKVWDISDLEDIRKVTEYTPDLNDIVHNVHVKGRYAIVAWYTAGVRVIDIVDPTHPREVGFYDTYPGPSGGYNGVWESYGYFPSGKIIAGDRSTGLYVLEFNNATAGSISGTVRDASTGQPLAGVAVSVPALGGRTTVTDAAGRYYVGSLLGADLTVNFSSYGYGGESVTETVTTDLVRDIELDPLPFADLVLRVQDDLGRQISDFQYAVLPVLPATASVGGEGALRLPRDSAWRVTVGTWGSYILDTIVHLPLPNNVLQVTLLPRYQDNATLDLGWSLRSPDDSATTGNWVRFRPYLGYVGSGWFHPAAQPDNDTTGLIFGTGLPPVDMVPQSGDVNRGHVTLTSPPMDLTRHTNPTVSVDLWCVHYPRSNADTLIDSFRVQLSNDNGATWVDVYREWSGRANWKRISFAVTDFLPLSDSVRVRFRASDTSGEALMNAAIDNFDVSGSPLVSGVPRSAEHGLRLLLAPQPARDRIALEFSTLRPLHGVLELLDLRGAVLGELGSVDLDAGESRLEHALPSGLPTGGYAVRLRCEDGTEILHLLRVVR